jgi:NAD(P)-dependent dehydrogenase (short-subunit alcohol dehydrogenase family)
VYATARRPETLGDLASLGCRTLALDVTDEASLHSAVESVEAAEGAVGVLVNNAGYSQSGALETVPPERIRRQFETNVFGPLRLCQLVLPGMRRQGWGRIVNLSSMGGRFTLPGGGAYHATKYAVEALSDALRFEVGGFGIEVVVVEPGLIRTDFDEAATRAMEGIDDGPYAEFQAAVAETTRSAYQQGPLARLGGGPDDVARVIEQAIVARRPRTRYLVTPSARVLIGLRAVLPDRIWDTFLRQSYPQPGRSGRAVPPE